MYYFNYILKNYFQVPIELMQINKNTNNKTVPLNNNKS